MNASNSPFDDPEIQAMMRERGIVHRPGMAQELMQELAPLLAAEGIDFEAENPDYDLDQLNAAMERSVEQRNLTLFTPVGRDRDEALALFVEIAEALAADGQAGAQPILASIQSEATATRPAASHVIGAGLGLIDTWFAGGEYTSLLARLKIHKWRGPARKIATDLRSLGASRRAFESLGSFTVRHGGELLMQGVVLLVASAILAVAEHERASVAEAFAQLQDDASPRDGLGRVGSGAGGGTFGGNAFGGGSAPHTGSAFGLGANGQPAAPHDGLGRQLAGDALFIEGFEEWLGELSPDHIDAEITILQGIEMVAGLTGLSVHDPHDYSEIVGLLSDFEDSWAAGEALDVLHDYVHFRVNDDMFPEEWEEAHAVVEDAQMAEDPLLSLLHEAIGEAAHTPSATVHAALEQLLPVTAVRALLAWLGKSQGITATGGLKRSDIATVAAMIGVRAEGVAKLPPVTPYSETDELAEGLGSDDGAHEIIYAQTMWDVPELAYWWTSLQAAGAIELTATRVRPGASVVQESGEWTSDVALEVLCAVLVAQVLQASPGNNEGWYHQITFNTAGVAAQRLIEALGRDGYRADDYDPTNGHYDREAVLERMYHLGTTRRMHTLQHFGFLEERDGALFVPAPLRGVVGRGIMLALEFLAGQDDE